MKTKLTEHLTTLRDRFVVVDGRASATVGRLAAGDWRFFDRLDGGASFQIDTYDRVVGWFSANWPPGVEWPEGIDRPVVIEEVA